MFFSFHRHGIPLSSFATPIFIETPPLQFTLHSGTLSLVQYSREGFSPSQGLFLLVENCPWLFVSADMALSQIIRKTCRVTDPQLSMFPFFSSVRLYSNVALVADANGEIPCRMLLHTRATLPKRQQQAGVIFYQTTRPYITGNNTLRSPFNNILKGNKIFSK